MKKNQLKLNEIWSKNKILSEGIHSTVDNEIEILSTTSSSSSSIPSTSISTPLSSINSSALLGDRQNFSNDCREHISQLPEELTKRFTPSVVQGNLSILFDPQYLIQHKNNISSTGYGRDYINSLPSDYAVKKFWKNLILLKQTTNNLFNDQYKNILLLLDIYLISSTKYVECERGFSAINRAQTIERSRLMVTCQQVVSKAFESWSDLDYNRPKVIKCANRCKTQVSDDDPTQNEAIQCRHQSEQFDWIDYDDNCSR
ncbi:unnamed protein product [Rotaria sordida]|uniref:Uncharacterized protein n=1 Tax=Rotaria sordida TaxID=392033 RepID=A0A815FEA5_9BILA|nr:unnamed protein product [Rotaria sordida]